MKKLQHTNSGYTDKNTTHSYLPLYEELLNPIQDKAHSVLEIGIGSWHECDPKLKSGSSILMWENYFSKAQVYAIDIASSKHMLPELFDNKRLNIYCNTNAYNKDFIKNTFINKKVKFDFILDDGPHTLDSMKLCISLYNNLLTEKGILIIEDVQSTDWFETLKKSTPAHLKKYIKTYDRRHIKGKRDDLIFTIDKLNT